MRREEAGRPSEDDLRARAEALAGDLRHGAVVYVIAWMLWTAAALIVEGARPHMSFPVVLAWLAAGRAPEGTTLFVVAWVNGLVVLSPALGWLWTGRRRWLVALAAAIALSAACGAAILAEPG